MLRTCLAIAVAALTATAAAAQPADDKPPSGIGFPSVAATLDALRTKPGAEMMQQDGWTVVSEPAERTMWSFTPPSHPAHPGVVRRTILETDDGIAVQMSILCEATKSACDGLLKDFTDLNTQMREHFARQKKAMSEAHTPAG